MAEAENQPEGLEFANINGKVTLEDFMDGIDDDDDDRNVSDDDFVHNEQYQKEFNEETRLEKNEGLAIVKIMMMPSALTWNSWYRILVTYPISKILDSGPVSTAGSLLSAMKLRSVEGRRRRRRRRSRLLLDLITIHQLVRN
jgi:hypothetical protein